MRQLTCEMCGSTDLVKQDGVFICQTCGCKYSVEEAKKMMVEGTVDVSGSTVKVDNSGLIDSYLQMAENALESNNNAEAESYSNKIIEIDPKAYKAWFIKGKAAGWQTTGKNNRYPESIVNWINSYQFAPEEEKGKIAEMIKAEAMNISTAILQMELNSFTNFRSDSNKNDIDNALSMIEKQLGLLKEKTGIDVYTVDFKTLLGRTVNGGGVGASNAADKDFGPENRNRDKFQWDRYTAAQDQCLSLLNKAYSLSSDDDLCLTICKNYVAIAKVVRDSCSYKFQASAYSNGTYIKEYSFTDGAKQSRTKTITAWEEKQKKHDPELRRRNCNRTLELVSEAHGKAGKELAIAQYWQEHSNERAQLEEEKSNIETKIKDLDAELNSNADKAEIDKIETEIGQLRSRISLLGLFKGKEKKALQAQIAGLEEKKKPCISKWDEAQKEINGEKLKLTQRRGEIEKEFVKDRGIAKSTPKRYLALYENGKFLPTALQLVEYNTEILPDGMTVKGTGNEAIENYTRSLLFKANAMLAVFGALAGKKNVADDLKLDYEDDPNKIKVYRINFEKDGQKTDVSLNFSGKTHEGVIEDSGDFVYSLEEEKTPEKVATFIRIVSSSVLGICPNLDLNHFGEMIANAAFGLGGESEVCSDNIRITVTGSTKSDTKVKLESISK